MPLRMLGRTFHVPPVLIVLKPIPMTWICRVRLWTEPVGVATYITSKSFIIYLRQLPFHVLNVHYKRL